MGGRVSWLEAGGTGELSGYVHQELVAIEKQLSKIIGSRCQAVSVSLTGIVSCAAMLPIRGNIGVRNTKAVNYRDILITRKYPAD